LKTNTFQAKAPARLQRCRDPLEDAPLVLPRRQVEHRAGRAVDERGRLVQRELPHVFLAQLQLDTRLGRAHPRQLEHRRRGVDPEQRPPDRLRDRNRHPPVPDPQLDHRPAGLARQLDVERHVLGHVRGPVVVDGRERVVRAHEGRSYSRRVDPNALETEAQSAIARAGIRRF
jgi:hypothetical protein